MNDYSGRENLSQCVRSLFGCCLGKCCDSTAAAPGFLQSCEKMKINSLGLILIENQCQLFLIVKLRKGLFQLLLFLFHSNAWTISKYHHTGVDPQHPYFAETDTTRVHIEPLSQVELSSNISAENVLVFRKV